MLARESGLKMDPIETRHENWDEDRVRGKESAESRFILQELVVAMVVVLKWNWQVENPKYEAERIRAQHC